MIRQISPGFWMETVTFNLKRSVKLTEAEKQVSCWMKVCSPKKAETKTSDCHPYHPKRLKRQILNYGSKRKINLTWRLTTRFLVRNWYCQKETPGSF
jgi:hypothetical protein